MTLLQKNLGAFLSLGFLAISTVSCMTSGSHTGATLPQPNTEYSDKLLEVEISHNCDGVICSSFSAHLQNLSKKPIAIHLKESFVARAGTKAPIRSERYGQKLVAIPPLQSISLQLEAFGKSRRPQSYGLVEGVWCQLKKPSTCEVPKAEAECIAAASYYYEAYMRSEGWVSVGIAYSHDGDKEVLYPPNPSLRPSAPPKQLGDLKDFPGTFSLGKNIVHTIECNDKCKCKVVQDMGSFAKDHGFKDIKRKK